MQVDEAERIKAAVAKGSARSLTFVPLLCGNLVDAVWDCSLEGMPTRVPPPQSAARALPLDVAGKSVAQKLELIAKSVVDTGASAYLVSALDEVHAPIPDLPPLPHRHQ